MTSPVNANRLDRMSCEVCISLRVGSGFVRSSFNMMYVSCLSPRRFLCLQCPLPEKPMPPLQHSRRQGISFATGNHGLAVTIADRAANSKKISSFCRGQASAKRDTSHEHLPLRSLWVALIGYSAFCILHSPFPPGSHWGGSGLALGWL